MHSQEEMEEDSDNSAPKLDHFLFCEADEINTNHSNIYLIGVTNEINYAERTTNYLFEF